MNRTGFITLIIIGMLMSGCKKETVDVILHNGRIYTMDEEFSTAEAMAVKDGRIVAVGSNEEISEKWESEKNIDLKGEIVYPGFIDAHAHFTGYAENLYRYADLVDAASFDEVLDRLDEHDAQSNDAWLCGRGWDQNDWPGQEYPDKTELDKRWPDTPVYLVRIDYHAALVNSKALEMAGITADSRKSGGEYVKKDGELTGVLVDNAMDDVRKLIPPLTKEQWLDALKIAEKNLIEAGLTMVSDAGLDKEMLEWLDGFYKAGELKIRDNAMMYPTEENYKRFLPEGPYHSDRLTIQAIKLFGDGALGSRGAYLLEDYADDPGNRGFMLEDTAYYEKHCRKAAENGFQVCSHSIGDASLRVLLDVYEPFVKDKNDHRWRIEHAQTVHPDDVPRFGELDVIPSIQTTHCTSDMDWARIRLGEERLKTAYVYQDLLEQTGWIINGTDFPIEEISPLYTFYAAVFRTHHDGTPKGGFQMENALSREDALRSMTIWAAKGSFDENTRGSLETGKFADFVILDTDLMEASPKEVLDAEVLGTWIQGEKLY
ncbi:MAG TPA: amidohydrolase [Bacteroidales bacterium]|nr:amidohydrolase [Bacteroidales bacterium]